MSIRPVDLQIMVQKSGDINKTHNQEGSRATEANQQFAEKFQKEVSLQDKQVLQNTNAEGRNVDKDGKNQNQSARQNKKRKQEKDKKSLEQNKTNSMFDVKI